MFVKKLVEKASYKKPDGIFNSLSPDEVNPRLVFHYGIPSRSILLAYDSIQKILAISTQDGRIKLVGKDNGQALLESNEAVASKCLQFFENSGFLLNVTVNNHIEVWDIERKLLSYVHACKEEVTSLTVMQRSPFVYVGDAIGNVLVLQLDQDPCCIVTMKYNIPVSASRGDTSKIAADTAVVQIMPQPAAESKRLLIIYRDGSMILWDIKESRSIFTAGGKLLPSLSHDAKRVTSACWACPFGSKVAVGYSNGDIFIWSVSPTSNSKCDSAKDKEFSGAQSGPICKLNLGYKLNKIPIAKLKWMYADGKASRLYVMGASDSSSSNLLQIILLNEQSESPTIKLALHPPEACLDIEIISTSGNQSKHKQDFVLLLGQSSHIYVYDDILIEKFLLQCQSRSSPSIPREVMVKLPFADSSITVAKFMTDSQSSLSSTDKDYGLWAKFVEPLLPLDVKPKEGACSNSNLFGGFTKIKNLYITGHSNGAINFWDLSCTLLVPVLALTQQSEDEFSLSGVALTALHFDTSLRVLVSGDQNGMVRIYKLKSESFGAENGFMFRQGSTKKGSNHIIKSVKVVKVDGAVICMSMNSSRHLAVGSDLGYVSLVDIEENTIILQKHIPSDLCTGIISLQFEACNFHGFEKKALIVATRDSSILALDADTGNSLSNNTIHPKKPSKALLMHVLDGQEPISKKSYILDGEEVSRRTSAEGPLPKRLLLLLCSEKAAYVYSFMHSVQGVKKVCYKKKFHPYSCSWASTFHNKTSTGLVLLFTSGKLEIRSLPELSLLKECSMRGIIIPTSKSLISDISICSSWDGEIIMVNQDQEIFFVSLLLENEIYRPLDSLSQVYNKHLKVSQESHIPAPINQREKRKGFFSSVIKDIRGIKERHESEMETEDSKESIEELSVIFSAANFPFNDASGEELALHEDEADLDIDDIDLEDSGEKLKEHNTSGALNKQKLTSKFQALKGKLKQMKVENEKASAKESRQDQKAGAVDQIKKKYGFSPSGESSVAKIVGSKLNENLMKLQGISMKTTEMQDTARSFSFMAKEVLRSTEEQDKRSS